MDKMSTEVLGLTREHQMGRVGKKSTSVDFNFTEGFFRRSGLYAPMDLFDWLDIIERLRKNLTLQQIAERIGWKNKQQVGQYIKILDCLSTEVLNLAKNHQDGRVDRKSTDVYCNFTEGFFRRSGLYAPMDLFDWLDIIGKLRAEGLTQKEIGERVGWSRTQISYYTLLIDKIATEVLNLVKSFQDGRVAENATSVAHNFTEGFFRNLFITLIGNYLQFKK